ncbi:hypothetical protein DPMN_187633 [Dreissena polymorpha]|uniref:Uncharacterized protein n=1 Tax=Dreissena polymorpha TaxID=45954 RepID=A0A9D4DSH6_DREPO|nr:hypothetical protein DPMN_187633 [Dreissena polymorpha]
MKTMQHQLQGYLHDWDGSMQSLEASYQEIRQELAALRQKINAAIDKLETATAVDMDNLRAKLKESLKRDKDQCISVRAHLAHLSDTIKEIHMMNKEQSFIAYEKCKQQLRQAEMFVKETSSNKEYSMAYIARCDIEHYLSTLTSLGTIVRANEVIQLGLESYHSLILGNELGYNVTSGICQVSTGEILISDSKKKFVKLLDKSFTIVQNIHMWGYPTDICHIADCEVACPVIDKDNEKKQRVQFLTVEDGRMSKGREFELDHPSHSKAYRHGDLYITSGTALYLYDLNGTQMKKLYEDTSSEGTLRGILLKLKT